MPHASCLAYCGAFVHYRCACPALFAPKEPQPSLAVYTALQVCLALPDGSGEGAATEAAGAAANARPPLPVAGQLADALGVAMQPFLQGSSAARVALASTTTAAAAVVEQLQKQQQ